MRFVNSILITNSICDMIVRYTSQKYSDLTFRKRLFGCSVKTTVLKRISKLEASRALSFFENCGVYNETFITDIHTTPALGFTTVAKKTVIPIPLHSNSPHTLKSIALILF